MLLILFTTRHSALSCSRHLFIATPLLATSLFGIALRAQQLATGPSASDTYSSSLPDSPAPQTGTPSVQPATEQNDQTKRILDVIPNFRSVNANQHLPAQSVKEKFITATEDSFDYSSIALPAVIAGGNELRNNTPEFGGGAVGYGRYFWHAAVDQTVENYMVEAIFPSLTHEDDRYYTLGSGGFWQRTGYALSRAVVTRSDSGKDTFNISEVIGAGSAAGISNLYYPSRERTFANTGSQWGLDVGVDALAFVVKEFWPDINHALFHTAKSTGPATTP